ncbi:Zinc metalloproteinase nas-13 [Blattella germanica]|nr:Zinc metalloproteinase nas-13 [Blattella germanica]
MYLILVVELCLFSLVEVRHPPPKPAHPGNPKSASPEVARNVASWNPNSNNNAWELSGQFEGDIMLHEEAGIKNALQDDNAPKEDQEVILGALKEYHTKTCVKFRPYKKGDEDFITIQGKQAGCWSFVGRRGGGQVVNLQNPGCVHHGIVIHELLHALGFYHQQSTFERDAFVKINWENIKMGKEHNFRKYGESTVTNFGVKYDYGSIMHYSAYAFSKNGKPTIKPLESGAEIGQREGLSEKDILKLSKMYGCHNSYYGENEEEYPEIEEEKPDIEEEEENFMFYPRTTPSK